MTVEKPEPLVSRGETLADCIEIPGCTRGIDTYDAGLTVCDAERLRAWLPQAIAWVLDEGGS